MSINPIHSIAILWILLGALPFPLDDYVPCSSFQHNCKESQEYENADVCSLPFLLRIQDVKALKDVEDAQDNDAISDGMVVDVPVESVLVILVWPQEQSK